MPSDDELRTAIDEASIKFEDICRELGEGREFHVVGHDDLLIAALLSLAATVNTARMQAVGLMLTHESTPEIQIGAKSFKPKIVKDGDK